MFQLHGFMSINSLIDNNLTQVSKLGELSSISRTFSREIGEYTDDENRDVRLLTFYSVENETKTPLSNKLAKDVLTVGHWLSAQALRNQFTNDRTAFIQALTAEFATLIKIKEVGKMVTDDRYWLPEYITFTLLTDTRENRYKIWFTDTAFRNQYDKFELEIIPPIRVVDDFYKSAETVKQLVTENTVVELHRRVNEKANKLPYTLLVSYTYDWLNPTDNSDKVPTTWTVLLYGNAANNSDIIRDALVNYVLNNSDYTRDQWQKLLPDLFVPTEFYLCPVWNKFSTPNLQLQGGLYSPVVPHRDVVPFAKRCMVGYTEEHIAQYSVVFDSIFKSCAVIACGHVQNRLSPIEFEKTWPEYANIYTTSRDFNRISPETQDFIMIMNSLFVEAETMTPDTEIPDINNTLKFNDDGKVAGYTRVRRGDMYYITASINSIQYLVPLRYNFLSEIALSANSSVDIPVVNPQGDKADAVDRMNDVINLVPGINVKPGYDNRGRPTITLPKDSAENGGIIVDKTTPQPDGLEGTPVNNNPSTPAAEAADRNSHD